MATGAASDSDRITTLETQLDTVLSNYVNVQNQLVQAQGTLSRLAAKVDELTVTQAPAGNLTDEH